MSGANQDSTSMTQRNGQLTKRLHGELAKLLMGAPKGVSAFPDGDCIFKWVATVTGGEDTCYSGQAYKLQIQFGDDYPFSAPIVKFRTPIFHPNVDEHGNICLDILKEKWSALYDVKTLLLSLQSLLAEPNIKSPLNVAAANLYPTRAQYTLRVQEHYEKHADKHKRT